MRVLATFATRDIADSMRERLVEHGFNRQDMVLMANRVVQEPPKDAQLEIGNEGEKGFAGLEEKIGNAVNALLGRHELLEGTGSEGDPNGGALLTLTVTSQQDADKAVQLLKLHQAADIEVTNEDQIISEVRRP
jgi:hypothetical protein